MNATSKIPGFVPTKKVSFPRDGFQTIRTTAFANDGYHAIPLEMLCNDYVDEGGELAAFLFEASGGANIDYESILKCHVEGGVVKNVYVPGIMGGDDKLFLVSGDNQFEMTLDSENQQLILGSLRGKLQEKEYKKADGTDGKSVSVLFTPQDKNLKVIYEIPFIIRKWDELKELLEGGAEISKELFDWLLSQNDGIKAISSFLMQTLGSGGDRKKLYELGLGRWRVRGWKKIQAPADSKYPPNYLLKLEDFEGVELPGEFYTNKSITQALDSMGAFFSAQKANGRDIQLLITDIRPFGEHFAVTGGIQVAPQIVNQDMMKSAAVGQDQLPQSKVPPAQTVIDVSSQSVTAVTIDVPTATTTATTTAATVVDDNDHDYDPIPF